MHTPQTSPDAFEKGACQVHIHVSHVCRACVAALLQSLHATNVFEPDVDLKTILEAAAAPRLVTDSAFARKAKQARKHKGLDFADSVIAMHPL